MAQFGGGFISPPHGGMPGQNPVPTEDTGVKIVLGDGSAGGEVAPQRLASHAELDTSGVDKVLGRVEGKQRNMESVVEFQPVKKTRVEVPGDHPAAEGSLLEVPTVPTGPLKVLRTTPSPGTTGYQLPMVSISFSHPVTELTSVNSTAVLPHVSLNPPCEGEWRYLGTQLVQFKPAHRFRYSTEYEVKVGSGMCDVTGGCRLEGDVVLTFATPKVQCVGFGCVARRGKPLLKLEFNQEVTAAVLPSVSGLGKLVPVTDDELRTIVSTDQQFARMHRYHKDSVLDNLTTPVRVWATPSEDIVGFKQAELTLDTRAPSAEGPLLSEKSAASIGYAATVRPLELAEHVTYGEQDMMQPLGIHLTNELYTPGLDEAKVQVTPAIPDMKVTVEGTMLTLHGKKKGKTQYEVRLLPGCLEDVYCQQNALLQVAVTTQAPLPSLQPLRHGDTYVVPYNLTAAAEMAEDHFVGFTTNPYALSFAAVNVKDFEYTAWAVDPKHFADFQKRRQLAPTPNQHRSESEWITTWAKHCNLSPKGSVRATFTQDPDTPFQVNINTAKFFKNGKGHAVFLIKGEGERSHDQAVWVQATDIGITAFSCSGTCFASITELATGKPLSGATINNTKGATGADGVIALPAGTRYNPLLATYKEETAFIVSLNTSSRGNMPQTPSYAFTDRGLYKPGETVHIKGVHRVRSVEGSFNVLSTPKPGTYSWKCHFGGKEMYTGTMPSGPHGSWDFEVKLDDDVALGHAMVQVWDADTKRVCNVGFKVAEFRTPEYEVQCSKVGTDDDVVGGATVAEVSAKYLAGGSISNASVSWTVRDTTSSYVPPGRHGYSFQHSQNIWRGGFGGRGAFGGRGGGGGEQSFESTTDSNGRSKLLIEHTTTSTHDGTPHTVTVDTTVQDINRQQMTGSTSFVLHPSEVYVGLKAARTAHTGKDFEVSLCTCGIAGAGAAGTATLKVTRGEQVVKDNQVKYEDVDVSSQECTTGSEGEGVVTLEFEKPGQHKVTATVLDGKGRVSVSSVTVWVNGTVKGAPETPEEQLSLQLITDKEAYTTADVAKVSIVSPFAAPLSGWVMWMANGILQKEQVELEAYGSKEVTYQLTKLCMPGISCDVKLNKCCDVPALVQGNVRIPVSTDDAGLDINLAAPVTAQPGDDVCVGINTGVKDCEVTLYIVDEAVLSLAGYVQQDPVQVFYQQYHCYMNVNDNRSQIQVPRWDHVHFMCNQPPMPMMAQGFGGARGGMMMKRGMVAEQAFCCDANGGGGAPEEPPVNIRSNFSPIATFQATLMTDSTGAVTCKAALPDNLTRYRVLCFAHNGTTQQFGIKDTSLQVSLPLMVRPSLPRFLMTGDKCQFTVVLQSNMTEDNEVMVACRSQNLNHEGPKGYKVLLAGGKRAEVRFDIGTRRPGKAVFEVVAVGQKGADAASIQLPVYTSGVRTYATHGTVLKEEGLVVQKVSIPSHALESWGGLRLSMSSSVAGQLRDAVDSLVGNKYSFVESQASKLIALSCLKGLMEGMGPTDIDIEGEAAEATKELAKAQLGDGSFGYWHGATEACAWVTIHVAHALVLAQRVAFTVADSMVGRALDAVGGDSLYQCRVPMSENCIRELKAKAAYVLAKGGRSQKSSALAAAAMKGFDKLSCEAVARLAYCTEGAVKEQCVQVMTKNIEEGSDKAHVMERVTDCREDRRVLMWSSVALNAAVLEALLTCNKEQHETAVVKLCKGVMASRMKGVWRGSLETAGALVAVAEYCRVVEGDAPAYTAAGWVGEVCVADVAFEKKEQPFSTLVPMGVVPKEAEVVLHKQGRGALYYSMRLDYGSNVPVDSFERGLAVLTEVEGEGVVRTAEGYKVRLGATITVKHVVSTDQERDHVAVYGALAGGVEGAALVPTQGFRGDPMFCCYPAPAWGHVNLRDASVEAYTPRLSPGTHTLAYTVTATTAGTFKLPPTIAEEMYTPDVRGATTEQVVVVA